MINYVLFFPPLAPTRLPTRRPTSSPTSGNLHNFLALQYLVLYYDTITLLSSNLNNMFGSFMTIIFFESQNILHIWLYSSS